MKIDVHAVSKSFGTFKALDNVSLNIASGELIALLGPSGSGKTSLLRIIAGLEWPDEGAIRFDGADALSLSVKERDVGFVFQHYALFRHMNVFDNIAFGLRVRPRKTRKSEDEIRARVEKLLDLVQIGSLAGRYPTQLSGGQRQRVALARALAIEPKVLLLDEPFGALDAKVRKELRHWLRGFHDRVGLTSIFVTHDQEEALEVADRVVVMSNGAIEQIGTPSEVYDNPVNAFVFDFVGESNCVRVVAADGHAVFRGTLLDVDTAGLRGPGDLYFRPHEARIGTSRDAGLPATITLVRPREGRARVEAQIAGVANLIELDVAPDAAPAPGQAIVIVPTRARLFPAPDRSEAAA